MSKKLLRFHSRYVEPIRSGEKTDTWRKGDKRSDYVAGQTVDLSDAQHDDEVFARAVITDVRIQKLSDVDEQTAKSRGYGSVADFIASFASIYPDIQPYDIMTIISFRTLTGPEI